jgi:hypothetical protein
LLGTPARAGRNAAEDLIPLADEPDDLRARLVAMDKLARLYPDTFRFLLLTAGETLRISPTPGPPNDVRWQPS